MGRELLLEMCIRNRRSGSAGTLVKPRRQPGLASVEGEPRMQQQRATGRFPGAVRPSTTTSAAECLPR